MRIYTSEEILKAEDLYRLQDSFCSSGKPFKYHLTDGELRWAKFIKGKYSISDYVLKNIDSDRILTFNDPFELSAVLEEDGIDHKAVMLSDDTALQKLFFWLSIND